MGLSINFERLAVSAGEPIVVKVRCVNQADTYSVTASPVLVMDGTPPVLHAFSLRSTGLGINSELPCATLNVDTLSDFWMLQNLRLCHVTRPMSVGIPLP